MPKNFTDTPQQLERMAKQMQAKALIEQAETLCDGEAKTMLIDARNHLDFFTRSPEALAEYAQYLQDHPPA